MKRFAQLCDELLLHRRPIDQVRLLKAYFGMVNSGDAAWAVYLLQERRVPRQLTAQRLRQAALSATGFPEWLIESCFQSVGDVTEVITLLVPAGCQTSSNGLQELLEGTVLQCGNLSAEEQMVKLKQLWQTTEAPVRRVLHRLLLGRKVIGVPVSILARALAGGSGLDEATLRFRLDQFERPTSENYELLIEPESIADEVAHPYPFAPFEVPSQNVPRKGHVGDWRFEWEWHGVRAQLIVRQGRVLLCSEAGDVLNRRFPEIVQCAAAWSDGTVVEGFVVILENGSPGGGGNLSKRLGSRDPSRQLCDRYPAQFLVVDLLELGGQDQRLKACDERRTELASWFSSLGRVARTTETLQGDLFPVEGEPEGVNRNRAIALAHRIEIDNWEVLERCRQEVRSIPAQAIWMRPAAGQDGDRLDSVAGWRLLPDPLYVDAALIAAELGAGKRAALFARYSFAVRDGGDWVPIGKSGLGLTLKEIREIDGFVRQNSVARHGPVRSVTAKLVFRLRFSSVAKSSRHRSGLVLRDLEMIEFWTDRELEHAASLHDLQNLLPHSG